MLSKFFQIQESILKNLKVTYKRYLYDKIDFLQKLIGIIGQRGTGKTTISFWIFVLKEFIIK